MGTRGGTRRGEKASGGRAASAVAAALFFLPILASAASNSSSSPTSPAPSSSPAPSPFRSPPPAPSPSPSFSPPPFLAAETGPSGDRLDNWSLTTTIVPPAEGGDGGVAFVEPASVEEVQRVVRGGGGGGGGGGRPAFPSPLLTVGSGHSSGEVVSLWDPRTGGRRGTVLKTTRLLGMGLEGGGGGGGGAFVRAGAGVELADLHAWLAARGRELSMAPEIGSATVGSAAAASTKDSSVAGGVDDGDFGEGREPPSPSSRARARAPEKNRAPPYPSSDLYKGMGDGYLGALVRGVRYVNASGHLVELDSRRRGGGGGGESGDDAKQIRRLGGSFGLLGPVVDVLLATRPIALVETRVKIVPLGESESDLAFARRILALRNDCDNMMASNHEREEQGSSQKEIASLFREEEEKSAQNRGGGGQFQKIKISKPARTQNPKEKTKRKKRRS